ncbi:MAG TPA: hypothetical protein VFX59_14260 [Polyangiales bacterium]|nr:hypothetical protein [Polyangiales bacterium]
MHRLRMAACALALWTACGDDADEPELPVPERDAAAVGDAAPIGEPAKMIDAAQAMLDATLAAPEDAGTDASVSVDASAPLTRASLDVLFVIDNSGSMATEQAKLAREIPRMVGVLVTGDPYFGRERPVNAPLRPFTPVASLHLGVVSTNVGGMPDAPSSVQDAVKSCLALGDDGVLQASTEVAVAGVVAQSASEFEGYKKGDVVIPPDPSCSLSNVPRYQEFSAGVGDSAAFVCAARLGVRGCPFEQPLEAAWKALAPSGERSFVGGSQGQGDRANQGFVREAAALVVVVLTDEDDCSVTQAGTALFSLQPESEEQWGNLNLRCGAHGDESELLPPVERYLQGLRSLKPGHPERVVFAAITGVPEDAIAQGLDHDAILALPAMQFEEDPQKRGFPRAACERINDGRTDGAFPARRIVQTAQAFGAQSVLASICSESYAPAFDRVVQQLAPLLTP